MDSSNRQRSVLAVAATLMALPASAQEWNGPFDAASVVVPAHEAVLRLAFDADLDGDVDAIAAQLGTGGSVFRLSPWINDGEGVLTRRYLDLGFQLAPAGELLIESGYLDRDAYPDFTVVCGLTRIDYLNLRYANDLLSFSEQTAVALPHPARRIVLADLDSDGISDLVWLDDGALRLSTSGGSEAELALDPGTRGGLAVLPRNGPGQFDVFLALIGDAVHVVYGWYTGMVAGPVLDTDLQGGRLATGDIDGDGDIDALVASSGGHRILRRSAPGAWSVEPVRSGDPGERLADVDGDGDLDGVACRGGLAPGGEFWPHSTLPSPFRISINDGSGGFAPAFEIRGIGSPSLAGVADVDGDGDVDLIGGRCVYFADGSVRDALREAVAPPVTAARDIADFDGDGDPDASFSIDTVHVNDGSGGFAAEAPLVVPAPSRTRYVGPGFPGDFDGDGDVDLLAELRPGGHVQTAGDVPGGMHAAVRMVLLANDGAGALAALSPASVPGVTFAVDGLEADASLLFDVDSDGDLDLVTRDADALTSSRLWTNRGYGFFDAGVHLASDRVEWAGDVDLDGDADLLVARPAASGRVRLAIHHGYLPPGGAPAFGEPIAHTNELRFAPTRGVPVGDYAQDGYPDFVLATNNDVDVYALYNTHASGGTFTGNLSFDQGYVSGAHDMRADARVAIGDLNGDGIHDVLAGALVSDEIEVSDVALKTVGPGMAPSLVRFAQQVVPPGLLLDLDGDGDLDVLGSRIVFNRTAP